MFSFLGDEWSLSPGDHKSSIAYHWRWRLGWDEIRCAKHLHHVNNEKPQTLARVFFLILLSRWDLQALTLKEAVDRASLSVVLMKDLSGFSMYHHKTNLRSLRSWLQLISLLRALHWSIQSPTNTCVPLTKVPLYSLQPYACLLHL